MSKDTPSAAAPDAAGSDTLFDAEPLRPHNAPLPGENQVIWTVWLVYGAFYGGFVALVPAVIIDYLGTRNAGAIIGALYTSVAPGTLIGPPLAGYAYDLWGSYTIPLVASIALMALATLITFAAPDPGKWRAANPAP